MAGIAVASLLIASAPEASADIVASFTSGTALNDAAAFVGQSFTTTNLVPETNITFNFFSDVPPTTPEAVGTGFLLSQEYLGTPAALSSSTPGFLAQAAASGGEYSFGSAATLLPGTQYFLYENVHIPSGSISGGATYSGGQLYATTSSSSDFAGEGLSTTNFLVQGSPATAVPEPSQYVVLGVIAACLGLRYLLLKRLSRTLPAPAA
jgi:hypothetical protein